MKTAPEIHRKKPDPEEVARRCIVTRETAPKSGLVRFVVGPEGQIVPDILEKLPGRGIWVTAERKKIADAVKKKAFARAAKTQVTVAPDLPDQVEALLARHVVNLISLGRKAGIAVAGLEKVKTLLVDERAKLLIQASDGSERGKTALRPPKGSKTHVECLSSAELGMAFGRDSVIHAAMTAGGITDKVMYDAARLAGLRILMGRNDQRTTRGKASARKG